MRKACSGRERLQALDAVHRHLPALGVDQPDLPQVVQRLARCLARGTGPPRELLLRDAQRDAYAVVARLAEALRQLDQSPGNALDCVEGGELEGLAVSLLE